MHQTGPLAATCGVVLTLLLAGCAATAEPSGGPSPAVELSPLPPSPAIPSPSPVRPPASPPAGAPAPD